MGNKNGFVRVMIDEVVSTQLYTALCMPACIKKGWVQIKWGVYLYKQEKAIKMLRIEVKGSKVLEFLVQNKKHSLRKPDRGKVVDNLFKALTNVS